MSHFEEKQTVQVHLTSAELAMVKAALGEYRELISSPTSADRDARGQEWADQEVVAADALLQGKLAMAAVMLKPSAVAGVSALATTAETQGAQDAAMETPAEVYNVQNQKAVPPFYIWANVDCDNKSENFKEAKKIRLELFNAGARDTAYIVDADGVEVVDKVIEAHEALRLAGYFAGPRNAEVKPGFPGAWMVMDPNDPEGYAIVGDDVDALILEARDHLLDPAAQEGNEGESQPAATKLVEVRLSALTKLEYMEIVEVPANITPAELADLVNARYQQVDGGEYTSDPEYWKRDTCEAVDSDMPDATPTMVAFRTEHGLHIERADARN